MIGARGHLRGSDSAQIRLELWRSLISTLRGYSRDPNLAQATITVAESAPANVVAACGGAKLNLSMNLASGIGVWSLEPHLRPADEGSFELRESGTVSWNRQEKEFDQAAIEWVGDLTRRSQRQQEFQKP